MQGTSIDLPIEMSEKCAIGSEKKTEINSGVSGGESQSALSLLSFVSEEDESL
jgi:hypothetical protein